MHPDAVRVRVRIPLALIAVILITPCLVAQAIDATDPHIRANDAFTPRGEAAPLPVSSFSVSHGIGIVTDDGNSYWPGYPSDLRRRLPSTSFRRRTTPSSSAGWPSSSMIRPRAW